jgi:hypothetical protein
MARKALKSDTAAMFPTPTPKERRQLAGMIHFAFERGFVLRQLPERQMWALFRESGARVRTGNLEQLEAFLRVKDA